MKDQKREDVEREEEKAEEEVRLTVYKRVLISPYQQWLMNRHKTKVNNKFEVEKVYCERKTFSFSTSLNF